VLAKDADEASDAADGLGYPVALKAQSSALSHKSDAGGVILNLGDRAAVTAAWHEMIDAVDRYLPGVALDGILVEAMGERGMEMIVGARSDPDWGPVMLAGFGGVQAEVLKDVQLFAPTMTHHQIVAGLKRLRSAALLHGWRGGKALDVEALASLVGKLGGVMMANPRIREVDLNPVILYPVGAAAGAVALDALLSVDPA
jgi:hypothetical protein